MTDQLARRSRGFVIGACVYILIILLFSTDSYVMAGKRPGLTFHDQFVRVHRSRIVAARAVKEIHPWFHGDALLVLRDGAKVTLSRTHRARFLELFGA